MTSQSALETLHRTSVMNLRIHIEKSRFSRHHFLDLQGGDALPRRSRSDEQYVSNGLAFNSHTKQQETRRREKNDEDVTATNEHDDQS